MNQPLQLSVLSNTIEQTSLYFLDKAQKQVNVLMTIRNWLIGLHIIEFEQQGKHRAKYGEKLLQLLADQLKNSGIKGMSHTNLKVFRQFYLTYPQFRTILTEFIDVADFQRLRIGQVPPDQSLPSLIDQNSPNREFDLVNKLTFTHFVELIKLDSINKRQFYENQAILNSWNALEVKRAVESMLYERTGVNKPLPISQKAMYERPKTVEEVFKNPYVFEFLQIQDRPDFSETDLENSIISHLQQFLLELGKGFTFESRQKRITFGNTHYRIDLVFYHRILKCHVLVELKLGEFSHADAGQMNMYLNYFRENEMTEGDQPPIGIILCAGKDNDLVRYATQGLAHNVFVSKYLVNLPSEKQLQEIITSEKGKTPISR